MATTKKAKKDVIAYRRACSANGTGLSHYILVEKKSK
ncbi:MAG: modified peptide precursor CbpA [Planctomycetes bacterium]|nr:modified peptide precursor CbpA [Planctomycetota bacterium]